MGRKTIAIILWPPSLLPALPPADRFQWLKYWLGPGVLVQLPYLRLPVLGWPWTDEDRRVQTSRHLHVYTVFGRHDGVCEDLSCVSQVGLHVLPIFLSRIPLIAVPCSCPLNLSWACFALTALSCLYTSCCCIVTWPRAACTSRKSFDSLPIMVAYVCLKI